jgi:hypothetical protein
MPGLAFARSFRHRSGIEGKERVGWQPSLHSDRSSEEIRDENLGAGVSTYAHSYRGKHTCRWQEN